MTAAARSPETEALPRSTAAHDHKGAKKTVAEALEMVRDYAAERADVANDAAHDALGDMRDGLIKATDKAREATTEQLLLVVAGA